MALSSVGSSFFYGTSVGFYGLSLKGEITDISMSGVTCAEIETSNLAKTVKSFVLGSRDGGTVTIVTNFNDTPDMPVAGNNIPFFGLLGFSGGAVSLLFRFYIQSMSVETGIDAVITATYVLQITDNVTIS